MRLMLLTAALLAADSDLGAAAPAAPESVQTSAADSAPAPSDPAPSQPQVPAISMGRIVIVRDHHGRAAPAIVVTVKENGTIDAQLFRADHAVHAAEGLDQVDPAGTARGWFWPQRV